jgi:hypothetical protein
MLKKFALPALALVALAACDEEAVAPTPAVEAPAMAIVDGRPGRYAVELAVINASGAVVNVPGWGDVVPGQCFTQYTDPVAGNTFISNTETTIHVAENKNGANATCRFLDVSGVYEDNAETGDIERCFLATEDGTIYDEGTGSVTAAANNDDTFDDGDGLDGGNTTMRCQFKN